jgi:hypothetical protein
MPRILLFIFLIIQSLGYSQKTYNINKVDQSEVIIDGFVSEEEKKLH